ncbi:MAG: trypsin-like peptidase domain-containing protein, partial [Clostridia bacterium]|nr:trypsin-like peptidase domain-containing protein [Clostridia bacterium]
MKKYGHIISGLRKKQGLTQDQLGKKLNVSYQAVSKWENDLSEPDLETLEKLTNIFGISMSEFFDMANSQESSIKKTININDNDIKKDKNFLKTKPWYLVAGLGVLILILSLCALLIPVKYSGKQVFDKYESSVFYLSAKNSYETKSGTGFFINDNGLAVTIYENIKNCTSGKITLNNGKKYDIKKIVGVDKENNLAIIQISIKKSTPVKFGDSNDIEMGDKVYSITYTTEDSLEDANSVLAEGMIYKVESDNKGVVSFQTTATTEKSNKGGAVFNEYGELIGFVSRKLDIS